MSKNTNELGVVQTLNEFRSTTGGLTLDVQKTIVEMAIRVFEEVYVHLPLKIAMYAVNPVGRLKILQRKLEENSANNSDQELGFHEEMLDIFTSLRDLHTNYMLPEPFSKCVAILPFRIQSMVVKDSKQHTNTQRVFMVTDILTSDRLKKYLPPNFEIRIPDTFKKGVEVTHWNGIPIQRAVDINGNKNGGSNPAARFARGIENMTIRPMVSSLPPDEEWVVIRYRTEDGQDLEYRQEWLVVSPEPVTAASGSKTGKSAQSYKIGVDLTTEIVRKMKKILFAPQDVMESELRLASAESLDTLIEKAEDLTSVYQSVYPVVKKVSEDIGYIQLRSFSGDRPKNLSDDEWVNRLVDEFKRITMMVPKNGLIIDVRGNGGGYINFAERILQFLTPKEIIPEPYSAISTSVTLDMSQKGQDLKPWKSSLVEARSTGSIFSGGIPLTSPEEANSVGQIYHGPVVLVTDARCYSATDLFAAGFQDHQIGDILGAEENTGAGGANVWGYDDLYNEMKDTKYRLADLPMLPFRLAIRRNVRVLKQAGTLVEDLGIRPDIVYNMTRADLLNNNVDLIKKASEILATKRVRRLDAMMSNQAGSMEIQLTTLGISRIDLYVDGRPILSKDITDGTHKLSIAKPTTESKLLKIIGLEGNEVVAARKVSLHS
jgi:C-terminal processing protease CtpA/Prc